jgi:hypothetical protein
MIRVLSWPTNARASLSIEASVLPPPIAAPTTLVAMQNEPPKDFDYAARAQAVQEQNLVFKEAVKARRHDLRPDESTETEPTWVRWRIEVDALHQAISDAYPPGFWDAYRQLKAKDPAGLEHAVRFLEADPWFFRTGYIKSYLLRQIRRIPFDTSYAARLQQVVLSVAARRDGREFRHYCHLARRVDSPTFRAQLRALINAPDPGAHRRAGWVLYACEHRDRFQPTPQPRYPSGLHKAYEQLRAGNRVGIDPVITYLETNPWLPRHLHTWEVLIGLLSEFELSQAQIQRLQQAALLAVDHLQGATWRYYALLAPQISSESFEAELRRREELGIRPAGSLLAELHPPPPVGQHGPHFLLQNRAIRYRGISREADFYEPAFDRDLYEVEWRRELVAQLQAGDQETLEKVLDRRMLLHSPRRPKMGMLQRKMVRLVARFNLTEPQVDSLRDLALRAGEPLPWRRPQKPRPGETWWRYLPLLRKLDSPTFRAKLTANLESDRPALQTRARELLDLLENRT